MFEIPTIASQLIPSLLLQESSTSLGVSVPWSAVLLVVSVAGYALVNCIEIAIVGSNRLRTRHLAEAGNRSAQALERLREREDRFFAAIVLFQNLTVFIASSMAGFIAVDIAGGLGFLFAAIVGTAAIAVLGEATPKVLATKASDRLALFFARPMEVLVFVMRPVVLLFAAVPNVLSRIIFGEGAKVTAAVSEAELRMLIDISAEEGNVGEAEAELMERVFHFYDRRVNEVMIPRTEVVWLEAGIPIAEFYRTYDETPHSRFPVYRDSLDNVVGVINIKDVLRAVAQGKVTPETSIDTIARPAYDVPETKLVGELFVEMQERRQHMAIAVDEYGGTAGIVTLELLLEEMVGAVVDELGQPEQEFETIDAVTVRVDGGMSLHDIREELELELPEGDYETIAGYVLDTLGHIPNEGESIVGDGYRITVAEVKGRKIEEVVITRLPTSAPQHTDTERVS